jgi:hypothetical protein
MSPSSIHCCCSWKNIDQINHETNWNFYIAIACIWNQIRHGNDGTSDELSILKECSNRTELIKSLGSSRQYSTLDEKMLEPNNVTANSQFSVTLTMNVKDETDFQILGWGQTLNRHIYVSHSGKTRSPLSRKWDNFLMGWPMREVTLGVRIKSDF